MMLKSQCPVPVRPDCRIKNNAKDNNRDSDKQSGNKWRDSSDRSRAEIEKRQGCQGLPENHYETGKNSIHPRSEP